MIKNLWLPSAANYSKGTRAQPLLLQHLWFECLARKDLGLTNVRSHISRALNCIHIGRYNDDFQLFNKLFMSSPYQCTSYFLLSLEVGCL
jgi:hypothetical protein